MGHVFLGEMEETAAGRELLRVAQETGMPISGIRFLLRFEPEVMEHLLRFTHVVMRGPSELSAGMRELIAAFTSRQRDCLF